MKYVWKNDIQHNIIILELFLLLSLKEYSDHACITI